MRFGVYSALILLVSACATMEPKQHNQVAIPWVAPLVAPKPVVLPLPIGLSPPITAMVDPNVKKTEEPEAKPTPESSGPNRPPPAPLTSKPRPECIPKLVPHLGGDDLHDKCADKIPQNSYPGFDAFVNGKHFDAFQQGGGVLWEIKTDNFDTFTAALKKIVIGKQVPDLQHERDLANSCGFDFRIGVRVAAHQAALISVDPTLKIIVMDWC